MGDFADLFDDGAAPLAVRLGAGTPPDKAAEAAALSRRYGLPAAVAEQFAEDYRARAATEDAREIFKRAPRLGSWIAEQPDRAKVVHDDLENLGGMERTIGRMASYALGARPDGGLPTDIARAARLLFSGGASQAAAGYHGTAAAIRETLGLDATQAREEQRSSQAFVAKLREELSAQDSIMSRGVASGLTSAGQQLFSLPLGFAGRGGQTAMLGAMGTQTFGASYGQAREQGLSVPRSLVYGAEDATAEVVTERFLGAAGLVADAKAGTTAARLFIRDIMREIPGESAATLWQNFNAWANVNPDKPVADFLAEQPAALAETVIATTVGAGAQVGAIRGVQKVMGDAAERQAAAARAERNAALLGELTALGKASKTMSRDATTAREFIAQVADETGDTPTELYVSAEALTNSLNQSGISPEEFEAMAPVAARELRTAETGADVRIPVSEFVGAERVMSTLIDDLRVGVDEMTPAEAREFVKVHGEELQREVEAELQKRDDHAEFKAAVGAVRQQFETELGAAGRFRPEVNRAYADLLANFYGATAARLGMTPAELVQRYQLRVRADVAGGARTMEQAPDMRIDEGFQSIPLGDTTVDITAKGEHASINMVATPKDRRGRGSARAALERVVRAADAQGLTLTLTPESMDRSTSKAKLEKFYRSLGFVPNKGRNRDFRYSGAMIRRPTVGALNQPVYHGSPHSFEHFSLDNIGTGEGAQAFGWGLYFAENRRVAAGYFHALADNPGVKQMKLGSLTLNERNGFDYSRRASQSDIENVRASIAEDLLVNENDLHAVGKEGFREHVLKELDDRIANYYDPALDAKMIQAAKDLRRMLAAPGALSIDFHPVQGGVYSVEIPDDALDRMLLWDEPLSKQPESVRAALVGIYEDADPQSDDYDANEKGESIYQRLASIGGSQEAASKMLASAGIPGLRYLDQGSRDTGDGTYNVVVWDQALIDRMNAQVTRALYQGEARAQIALANDITASPSVISLLAGADLSSFIHESGHFFLEVQADLAIKIQQQIAAGASVSAAERAIVDDMNTLLEWFGVKGSPELSALDTWAGMTLDEKRESHETFARGFEKYAMEGNAPSLELQGIFQRFRSWLMQVYQTLRGLNVELTDDVRHVMGRMIASDQAIEEAEAARAMGPLFKDAESAGMTLDEFAAYQALARSATETAVDELQTRSLRDMKWLSNARDKALKARQKEVDGLRREVRMAVRAEVYSEPVYKAWQFLTAKLEPSDRIAAPDRRQTAGVDTSSDSLLIAIAKLGGISRTSAEQDLGVHPDYHRQPGVFGKPVFRLEGGRSADDMAGVLAEYGYLTLDENGKHSTQELEDKVAAELRGEAQYAYGKDYSSQTPGAGINVEGLGAARIDIGSLIDAYGPASEIVAALKARRMTASSGVDQAIIADKFGFDSGDALVQALVAAAPPNEVIEARTDQRMLETYGDISSPQALARAADEAVHNKARAKFIAAELKALKDATTVREEAGRSRAGRRNTVDVLARAAREYAQQVVDRLKVREIRPGQYAAAETRNAKLAEKALAAGKLDEAAMHKRNQLVNNYATRAAHAAQAEVRSARDYFKRFDKRSKTIDQEYQDQIEALLERFDFRATDRQTDRRKSLTEWYAGQVEMGVVPDIPAEILNEANRKSYRDMTLEEVRGLRETVEQIEHMGRLKNRLIAARDKRDFDAVAEEIAASVREHGGKERKVSLEPEKGLVPWLQGMMAAHRKTSSYMRQMDGGRDDGPLYDNIVRGMNERGAWEDTRLEQATEQLMALYEPLLKMRGGITGHRSSVFIPEINASLTRGGRLAVALNWGNADNRQRMLVGDGKMAWTEAQVNAILRALTAEELAFVNRTWEFLDSYWPEIAAKQKRITGVEPIKVEALPFTVRSADGQDVAMRGGYYPIKYDAGKADRAATQEAAQLAEDMLRGARTQATTRRGHTKERLTSVNRPLRLDLNVVTQHVSQVVHDLAWHEWLIDTNRLLRDERITSAIRDHYGPEALKTIRSNIEGIATADMAPQTAIDRALLLARSNVTRSVMGASLTTAFLQPFGLTQSIVRIGGKHVIRGLARWGGDALRMESSLSWITEKSEMMRLRQKTFNRELREISGLVGGKSKLMNAVDGGLFFMMRKMQLVADIPTWIGQYEKTLAEAAAGEDPAVVEDRAVAEADRAVLESQGGGDTKDLAEVQRKHQMLTQFYSYFSVTLNLVAESTARTDFKNPRAVAGWLGDMALLMVIPAIAPAALLSAARGDDDEDMAVKLARWQASYALGLFLIAREFSGAVQGYEYTGPPVGRVVDDTRKAGEQIAQGELDEPAVLAIARLLGTAFGIPTVQAIRSYKGWKAWDEGDAGPQAILLGPPQE